jgi:DNA primase
LEQALAFYQLQLQCHAEGAQYLEQRGVQDPAIIEELGIGYAPSGNLHRHLATLGHSFASLLDMGLINHQGRDAFCRRLIFPCRQFDLAVLWQAGFRNTTCAIGTHLTPLQFHQLSEHGDRLVYLVFDQDENQAGQRAAQQLARRLAGVSVAARAVQLPAGYDPNNYFVAGATAADFTDCLDRAQEL